jgi:hypothetical protein
MRVRTRLCRIVLLVGLIAGATASSACDSYGSVGVGVAYPGAWGGSTWAGGYGGGPVYR